MVSVFTESNAGLFSQGPQMNNHNVIMCTALPYPYPLNGVEFTMKLWYITIVLFDQSSCHCAYNDDALNVKRMNVKPGGAQAAMRNTCWNGKPQIMVSPDGRPKGMKLVLEERGVDTTEMKAADMALVLGNHHDFKHEKTALEHVIQSKGH